MTPTGRLHAPSQRHAHGVADAERTGAAPPAASAARRSCLRAADCSQCRPAVGPWMTHSSAPTGRRPRISIHGSSWDHAHRSMPTSRRRPPLPRRTSTAPRERSRSVSARGESQHRKLTPPRVLLFGLRALLQSPIGPASVAMRQALLVIPTRRKRRTRPRCCLHTAAASWIDPRNGCRCRPSASADQERDARPAE
jgi:hypothetical protein